MKAKKLIPKKKKGPYEKALREAEKRGLHIAPPDEKELSPLESDAVKLKNIYGSVDALPLEYARRALRQLNLMEIPDSLLLIWTFLKDEIDSRIRHPKRKYPRLRLERSKCDQTTYDSFYRALSPLVSDLPRPAKGKVVRLVIPKKSDDK